MVCENKLTISFRMVHWFWNFDGPGMFGFVVNLTTVSYFDVGTILKPNHAHAAMMGVFGMLAIALMVFVLRQTSSDAQWPGIEKYVRCAFWGTNVGLALMIVMSLLPGGRLQLGDGLQWGVGRGATAPNGWDKSHRGGVVGNWQWAAVRCRLC